MSTIGLHEHSYTLCLFIAQLHSYTEETKVGKKNRQTRLPGGPAARPPGGPHGAALHAALRCAVRLPPSPRGAAGRGAGGPGGAAAARLPPRGAASRGAGGQASSAASGRSSGVLPAARRQGGSSAFLPAARRLGGGGAVARHASASQMDVQKG